MLVEDVVDEGVPAVEDGVPHGRGNVSHDTERLLWSRMRLNQTLLPLLPLLPLLLPRRGPAGGKGIGDRPLITRDQRVREEAAGPDPVVVITCFTC